MTDGFGVANQWIQDNPVFQQVCLHAREIAVLESTAAAIEWDERTHMPEAASEYRGKQIATLRGLIHQKQTDPRYGGWLNEIAEHLPATYADATPLDDTSATVLRLHEENKRQAKLPTDLVEEIATATTHGQHAWESARSTDDFAAFLPSLERIIELKKDAAQRLADGVEGMTPYDALLEEYEPGARTSELQHVFEGLRLPLIELVNRIRGAVQQPDTSVLRRGFGIDAQRKLSRLAAERIGFDFARGRLDETSHPFCTTLGPHDCRILTRYEQNWLPTGLFATLHEAGHGMYEQGLRTEWFGLPPGSFASLGIHESQSRLWENQVGRSLGFWQWLYDDARRILGHSLDHTSLEQFHFAINHVQPSLIRIEADEATYNLHIVIRFELEQELIAGDLAPAELPEAWNERYQKYLGIQPQGPAEGVLQDIHWAAGLIGYFPTYTLGNLVAAQCFDAAQSDIGELNRQIARGQFAPLLEWLNAKIHRHGQCMRPSEMVQYATGQALSHDALIRQLSEKYDELYGL